MFFSLDLALNYDFVETSQFLEVKSRPRPYRVFYTFYWINGSFYRANDDFIFGRVLKSLTLLFYFCFSFVFLILPAEILFSNKFLYQSLIWSQILRQTS